MTLSDEIRKMANDPELMWTVPRRAIEDELVDWRERGLSLLGRNNGLVINWKDGTESNIIRFGPETAMRVGLLALADHLDKE